MNLEDELRFGSSLADCGIKRAFMVVRQSAAVQNFIEEEIWTTNPTLAALLALFAGGLVLMEAGHCDGEPDFLFCAAGNHSCEELTVATEMLDQAIH